MATNPKRLRKGTFSCVECKRRKTKCVPSPRQDGLVVCEECRRRGRACIGQDPLADDLSKARSRNGSTGDVPVIMSRATHAENQKLQGGYRVDGALQSTSSSSPLIGPIPPEEFVGCVDYLAHRQQSISNPLILSKVAKTLHQSLPSSDDINSIYRASLQKCIPTHESLTLSYAEMVTMDLESAGPYLPVPKPTQHPILLARYMLQMAIFLQHTQLILCEGGERLSEKPSVIQERLAASAIGFIASNDELLACIEGVECIMTETVYLSNVGSLRRSWAACRRAMSIAQLIGLHKLGKHRRSEENLDPSSQYNPQSMWFRIVSMDRFLCLALGLPAGCPLGDIASEASLANDTPMGRLERLHCVIATKLLDRNEAGADYQNLEAIKAIDLELQDAARALPSKWWLQPDLTRRNVSSVDRFWDMRRLFSQMFHYNLLNQLHLPYMLRASADCNAYARISCVNASREVTTRYIALRRFSIVTHSCRAVDFLALMAATTLLLAHMDGSQSKRGCALAHQYSSDRAMIEQAQENMQQSNNISSDSLSKQSADLLHRLLALNFDGSQVNATGGAPSVNNIIIEDIVDAYNLEQPAPSAEVHIPYFGNIKIARKRMDNNTGIDHFDQFSSSSSAGMIPSMYDHDDDTPLWMRNGPLQLGLSYDDFLASIENAESLATVNLPDAMEAAVAVDSHRLT